MPSLPPKYSKTEIERRWLVSPSSGLHANADRERHIEDRYILGTRLRLRVVTESNHEPIYKLGKKYESNISGTCQAISIYLEKSEYETLALLPARLAKKRRLSVHGGALDVYEFPEHQMEVFEVEFANHEDAASYYPPDGVSEEITNNAQFTGFALASSAA
jgi:CYTH domain-containing protein